MSELRTRMIRDMALRGFSPRTHEAYIAAVVKLARYYHRAPDQLTTEEVQAYLAHRGGAYDAAHHFAALCRHTGLRLLDQRGFLPAVEPVALLETFRAMLRSLGPGMIAQGITSQGEMDDLLGELDVAKGAEYISSFANLYIEMIAEVP